MQIQKILVPTDFSDPAAEAVKAARLLAQRYGASLCLGHVVPPIHLYANPLPSAERFDAERTSWSRTQLAELSENVSAGGIRCDTRIVLDAPNPAEGICRIAKTWGADLVVMGTHGRSGLELGQLGHVAERVIGAAPVPVMTLRTGQSWKSIEEIRRVLVPIDFSDDSRAAGRVATNLAQTFGAEVELLHVLELSPPTFLNLPIPNVFLGEVHEAARLGLLKEAARFEASEVKVSLHIESGWVGPEILDRAESQEFDLIVMGTRGLGKLKKWILGSAAGRVVRLGPCPVVTCHELA